MARIYRSEVKTCSDCPDCFQHHNGYRCSQIGGWVNPDSIHKKCPLPIIVDEPDDEKALKEISETFVKNSKQEPIPEEFEKVLNDNFDDLLA